MAPRGMAAKATPLFGAATCHESHVGSWAWF